MHHLRTNQGKKDKGGAYTLIITNDTIDKHDVVLEVTFYDLTHKVFRFSIKAGKSDHTDIVATKRAEITKIELFVEGRHLSIPLGKKEVKLSQLFGRKKH